MGSPPSGIRQTKTEKKIQEALIALLPTKGVTGISVSGICKAAHIDRSTFYAHYVDKFDLVERQVAAVIECVKKILLASDRPPTKGDIIPWQKVHDALEYVRRNYSLVAALSENGANANLQLKFKNVLGEMLEQEAQRNGMPLSFGGVPTEYGREMLLGSLTAVIWHWIAHGCVETVDEITDIIWTAKSHSPEELLQ